MEGDVLESTCKFTATFPFLNSLLPKDEDGQLEDGQVTEVVGIATQTLEKSDKEFPEMRGSEQIIFLEPSKQSQKSEYYIEFRKREKDKVTLYRDVSIDSQNGLLLLYRDNLSSEDDKNVATPKEIALKRAKAFLQDFIGQSFEEYQMNSVVANDKETLVQYTRFVNNLHVAGWLTDKPIFSDPSIVLEKSIN
ncbi:hypothetical protein EEL32_18885 [Brevibacillus laterosporus]|uniref:YcdB/YcdC repeated domain-containing protein n=1 Tax=Brevibacillus laterosporus TaxID=1465 RepID=A0A502I7Q3_BRELA|nr:hypothetical protein EEL30_27075 [Brevibacillus laterosporus]TPG82999.1 hypothetical protein EEL32_18885 [Brevibacillus laterosporus]